VENSTTRNESGPISENVHMRMGYVLRPYDFRRAANACDSLVQERTMPNSDSLQAVFHHLSGSPEVRQICRGAVRAGR